MDSEGELLADSDGEEDAAVSSPTATTTFPDTHVEFPVEVPYAV